MSIPRIIHLHWFGDKLLPRSYQKNLDRWQLLVAETQWRVQLWTDESDLLFPLLPMLFDSGASPVQVSNAMRFLCLYMFGGVYLDMDIIPLRLPEFEQGDRLNLFTETTWDTAVKGATGKKKTAPNHAYMAAPAKNRHVLDCFWQIIKHTSFTPKTMEERLKGGVGIFATFPPEWFKGIAMRGVNHFAPVNWAQARALNMVEHYTYDDWLTLSESFLQYPEVYGVHTFDSSWVADVNKGILSRTHAERSNTNITGCCHHDIPFGQSCQECNRIVN